MKSIYRTVLLVFLVSGLSGIAYSQVYEFDNCGAEGRYGPDPGDCNYGNFSVDIAGEGIQEWTVPEDGTYRISTYGAQGGPFDEDSGGDSPEVFGGKGAYMSAEFSLSKGEVYKIVVGQQPRYSWGNSNGASGGGGGTFVYKGSIGGEGLLMAAGGGGGSIDPGNSVSNPDSTSVSQDGVTTEDAAEGWQSDGTRISGGENGNGGSAADIGDSGETGGGAGWKSDGESVSTSDGVGTRGRRFIGGREDCADEHPNSGGWGGGAAPGENSCNDYAHGSGGGGGYSGGGSASYYISSGDYHGGGGGSFIASEGDKYETQAGQNTGHGFVEIELVGGQVGFCNARGPLNECIMNETNQLSEEQYNVSSIFESRETAVFEAFNGPAKISIGNYSRISGLWRGEFNIETEAPRLEAGASFRPENGRIKIGK